MSMQMMAIAFLATFCAGALAWVLIYPYLSGEREAEKRMQSVARPGVPSLKTASRAVKSRREQIETSLKEIEGRRKRTRSPSLATRLTQAGVSWTKQQFIIGSAVFGVVVAVVVFFLDGGPFAALGFGGAAGAGLPRWVLSYLKKRRESKFLDRFPDAIDVVIRGIRSGTAARQFDAHDLGRGSRTDALGIPPRPRDPGRRRDARRRLRPVVRAHADRGGEFLRHRRRHPAEERRQSVRGAQQSLQRCCASARK